ncbi:TetR/AcrR family transcriptional regulator [Streptomyces geranii]|uniref:TetR/AcrR family transcriptional regulator n=1 Tax=Streptomyces geranii TaxID=2058923 RepID=UPI0018E58F32|nr:TetR/AcrR family transcriptional regulator [Streptomyces geranii]
MTSSPDAARSQIRNTERTRHAILGATARVVSREGAGVSIVTIAREAGVSKGGVLHHFPTREALFEAVAIDLLEGFRRSVFDHLDLSENRPGKLLRAYVRTICDDVDSDKPRRDTDYVGWQALEIFRSSPGVAELVRADAERWETDLAADGLDPDRVVLVQLAADGLTGIAAQNEDTVRRNLARMRPLLLKLTEADQQPW